MASQVPKYEAKYKMKKILQFCSKFSFLNSHSIFGILVINLKNAILKIQMNNVTSICLVQCTLYSVQCTVYSVQCTVHNVQCTTELKV